MPDIEFDCIVHEVKTLVDQGTRIVLDLPEGCVVQAAELMQAKELGLYLHAQITGEVVDDKRREGAVRPRARKDRRTKAETD